MLPMLLSRWTQPSLSRLEERGREGWDTRVERGGILGRKWSKRGSERSGSSYRLTIASGRAYIYRVTQNCPLYVCLFVCLFVSLLTPMPQMSFCPFLPRRSASHFHVFVSVHLRLCLIRPFLFPKSCYVSPTPPSIPFLSSCKLILRYCFHGNRPKGRITELNKVNIWAGLPQIGNCFKTSNFENWLHRFSALKQAPSNTCD